MDVLIIKDTNGNILNTIKVNDIINNNMKYKIAQKVGVDQKIVVSTAIIKEGTTNDYIIDSTKSKQITIKAK